MSTLSVFPLDVVERFIDLLVRDDPTLSAIKACSLVCQDFLGLCRKRIFASIVLNKATAEPPSPNFSWIQKGTTQAFQSLISGNPGLAAYIRDLEYCILQEDLENAATIVETFQNITGLRSLIVQNTGTHALAWDDNPLRPAFLHILNLPTLTSLNLSFVYKFTVEDLLLCKNLEEYSCHCLNVITESPTYTASPDLLKLRKLSITGPSPSASVVNRISPLISFNYLTDLSITLENQSDMYALRGLLPHCTQLVTLRIDSNFPNGQQSLIGLAEMLDPSVGTLKHLRLESCFAPGWGHTDPLFGFTHELKKMAQMNFAVETVTINILFHHTSSILHHSPEVWDRLDTVLGEASWLSLHTVSLELTYDTFGEPEELVLALLTETEFDKLCRNRKRAFQLSSRHIIREE